MGRNQEWRKNVVDRKLGGNRTERKNDGNPLIEGAMELALVTIAILSSVQMLDEDVEIIGVAVRPEAHFSRRIGRKIDGSIGPVRIEVDDRPGAASARDGHRFHRPEPFRGRWICCCAVQNNGISSRRAPNEDVVAGYPFIRFIRENRIDGCRDNAPKDRRTETESKGEEERTFEHHLATPMTPETRSPSFVYWLM